MSLVQAPWGLLFLVPPPWLFPSLLLSIPGFRSTRYSEGFPGGTSGKRTHLPMKETQERQVWSLGLEDPLRAQQPTPGDLPDPGIKSASLASPALAGGFFSIGAICMWLGSPYVCVYWVLQVGSCDWRNEFLIIFPFYLIDKGRFDFFEI